MKTYSLLQFLKEPINDILDNEEDYNFKLLAPSFPNGREEKSISNITIPIIQRDYAQGREDNKELREEFIGKLFKHLETEENLKLDFIYGSLDHNNSFLPLDGQQRLTTLFLLHWYILKVETEKNSEEFEKYRHILSKFSYETRDTSRRFFKELVDFEFKGNPKESIEGSYWFNENFSLDPTISGALNTLETIHIIYRNSIKSGSLLKSLTKDLIVFYVLPMDQFKLTDDLYIKLNARGKPLSSFENFKADLIGFIKGDPTIEGKKKMHNGFMLDYYDIIANKFDNIWSDLFWLEAKNHDEKSVDEYFFRFVHRILINDFIINHKVPDINKDNVYKELQKKEKVLYYSNFELYRNNSLITTDFIQNLECILDFYSKGNCQIQKNIQPLWKKPSFNYSLYKQDNFTMDDRMIFDSINQYILNSTADINPQKFKEWMRVVWNLISDPDIRSIDANKTVMNVIRDIAKYSEDIYSSLSNGSLDDYINLLNNIHKAQLLEEKEKATFILHNREEWEKVIHEAERQPLLEGNIGLLLTGVESAEHLRKRLVVFRLLFNDKKPNELIGDESHSLIRYVISQFDSWEDLASFNFISNEINWKTHLRRNKTLTISILKLIELNDIESIKSEIQKSIKKYSSNIKFNPKQSIAHKNLYYDNKFHQWMQEDGTYKLKCKENHWYVVRPNAWYSKVMIDGFRNELITALYKRFNLKTENRELNNSGYYWGETIDFWKEIESSKKVTFHFDVNNKLHIGLWGELNPHIEDAHFSKDGWKQLYIFDVNGICSKDCVSGFVANIEETLNKDPECLFKSILSKCL